MYVEPNAPGITNEQKKIHGERIAEKIERNEKIAKLRGDQVPLVNFQMYQPPKPTRDFKSVDPISFMPRFVPGPFYNTGMPGYGYLQPPMQYPTMPIVKNYQVQVSAPGETNHALASLIYEDVLPGKNIHSTMNTIGERLTVHDFMRTALFNNNDGANIGLGSTGDSLLTRIKFAELNPYNTYKFSNNPYKGLPDGFLIYRSCYPIRQNETHSGVMCARNSMGVNVRLYKLTEGAYAMTRTNGNQFYEYDQWREIAFYEFIREHIIKQKLCPNFLNMFGYFVAEKSNIDFDKITQMRDNLAQAQTPPANVPNTVIQPNASLDPNLYMGKALVALTESVTYNLFGWASMIYQVEGSVRRMISTGLHEARVWKSILFQLMVALYVLQIKGIVIENFSLDNNVFIKDLTLSGNVTNHWKYKIDGIDYYIPNYGFLVVVDSNYKDIDDMTPTRFIQGVVKTLKLNGTPFGAGNTIHPPQLAQKTFEHFTRSFDSNAFNQDFINGGGVKPPSDILRLLDLMRADIGADRNYNIGDYFHKYMSDFMNNRIGTYLKGKEIENIRRDDMRDIKRGDVLVKEEGHNAYKFVLFLDTAGNASRYMTKDTPADNDLTIKTCPTIALMNYSRAEPILQNFKINESNLNEEDLLETYIIMQD